MSMGERRVAGKKYWSKEHKREGGKRGWPKK
jgi:hypothetical protein